MKKLDRRDFLLALSAAVATGPGCDSVSVTVEAYPGGVSTGTDGVPFMAPVTSNADFYVYQHSLPPSPTAESWRVEIADGDTTTAEIRIEDLQALEPRDVELTLQCIGSGPAQRLINNAVWSGLPLVEVLEQLGIPGPPEGTVEMRVVGSDGYHAGIPIADLEEAPLWLIWRMNGETLPEEHGWPARLMVPGRYGIKNIKWLVQVAWVPYEHVGYWDEFGWSHTGEYRCNGFIHLPLYGEAVESPAWVLGTAFAGSDPIAKVEFTDDGGQTWVECDVDYSNGPNVWTLWRLQWSPKAGDYQIQIRVTSESGQTTVMDPDGSDPLQGYDGSMLIPVTVIP